MEPLRSEVERELRRFGAEGSIPEIVSAWPAAVGEEVSRNAWPARVARDGVLHVHASSSAWAFELTQLAPVVLERLGEALGEVAPSGIRFAPGPVPEPAGPPAEETVVSLPEPTAEDVAEARRLTAEVGSEELRERIAEAAARSLQRARSDRGFW
jgi:hypothetical protein